MFRQFSFYSIVHSFSLSLFFFLILSTLIRINADVLSTRYRRQITPSPTSLHIPSFDDRTDRTTHITIVPSSSYRERGARNRKSAGKYVSGTLNVPSSAGKLNPPGRVEPPLRLDDDRARRKRVGHGESFHPIIVFPVSFLAFLTALGILYFPEEFRTHNNNNNNNNKSARITTQFQIYKRKSWSQKRS